MLRVNDVLTSQAWNIAAEDLYHCPTHREIQSPLPGSCRICGHELEVIFDDTYEFQNRDLTLRFIVAVVFSVPLLIVDFEQVFASSTFTDILNSHGRNFGLFLLSLPIVGWSALPFYQQTWTAFRSRCWNLQCLTTIGILVSFIYSTAVILAPGIFKNSPVFFSAMAAFTSFTLMARILETRIHLSALNSLRKMWELFPTETLQVWPDGSSQAIPIQLTRPGQVLLVCSNHRMPADGIILQGDGLVDESDLTGKKVLTPKSQGDKVVGGTLNQGPDLTIRAERVGTQTLIFNIPQIFSKAQKNLRERTMCGRVFSLQFVQAIAITSALVVLLYLLPGSRFGVAAAFAAGISVLMIGCPCALSIASPLTLALAMRQAVRRGIIFHSGEAVERLAQPDAPKLNHVSGDSVLQADLTFINRNEENLLEAKVLSQGAMKIVKQNLIFGSIYNLLALPLAAGAINGFLNLELQPIVAASVMTLSTLSVIANSLRASRL